MTGDWRKKLESQPGAVLATEMKNNNCKLAKWTVQAVMAGAKLMKIAYVARNNQRNNRVRPKWYFWRIVETRWKVHEGIQILVSAVSNPRVLIFTNEIIKVLLTGSLPFNAKTSNNFTGDLLLSIFREQLLKMISEIWK